MHTVKQNLMAIKQNLMDRAAIGLAPVTDLQRYFQFAVDALGCDMATLRAAQRAGCFILTEDGLMVIL